MNRMFLKISVLGCLAIGLGMVSESQVPVRASAKSRTAKVVRRTALKKTSYHANGGTLYTSTKLTKKAAKQAKSIGTTLFATKAAKLKKVNGKQATYYFVKNKRGDIKGWLWKGNLNKTKDLAQRASDIRRFKATFPLVDNHHDDGYAMIRHALQHMPLSHAYNISNYTSEAGIPSVFMAVYAAGNSKKVQVSFKVYNIFKGRFSHQTNAKLAKQKKNVQKEMAEYDRDADNGAVEVLLENASLKFNNTLGKAIHGLD